MGTWFESERLSKAADVREGVRRTGGDMTEGVLCGYVTRGRKRVQLRGWEKTTDHGGVGAQTAELKNQ